MRRVLVEVCKLDMAETADVIRDYVRRRTGHRGRLEVLFETEDDFSLASVRVYVAEESEK